MFLSKCFDWKMIVKV